MKIDFFPRHYRPWLLYSVYFLIEKWWELLIWWFSNIFISNGSDLICVLYLNVNIHTKQAHFFELNYVNAFEYKVKLILVDNKKSSFGVMINILVNTQVFLFILAETDWIKFSLHNICSKWILVLLSLILTSGDDLCFIALLLVLIMSLYFAKYLESEDGWEQCTREWRK